MPDPTYTLILVSKPEVNERWDFDLLAEYVGESAPEIATAVVEDHPRSSRDCALDSCRPTLTFSPGPISFFRPPRGRVFQGHALPKSDEYRALERAGVPVPKWALVTRDSAPDLTAFGPYVVIKPDRGGRGADVRITRKGRVRWKSPTTDLARTQGRVSDDWIVQEFVYTGPHPVAYRVVTLFGEPLWGWTTHADPGRRALKHRYDFHDGAHGGGMSIVSSGRGSRFGLLDDPEVFAFASRAHRAFDEIPLIGVDVVRDVDTGRLFVIEVNAIGYTWHLTSPIGRRIQQEFAFDLDTRFNVRRKAATLLVHQVRSHAR